MAKLNLSSSIIMLIFGRFEPMRSLIQRAYNFCRILAPILLMTFSGFTDIYAQQSDSLYQNGQDQNLKIDLHQLNSNINGQYDFLDFGVPIKLSGGPFYLITVGAWKMEKRIGQVQGELFREGNRFWPDPSRMSHIYIKGPFMELLTYNSQVKQYERLYQLSDSIDLVQMLNPGLSSDGDNLLICAQGNSAGYTSFKIISTQKKAVRNILQAPYLVQDWAINGTLKELITIYRADLNKDGIIDQQDPVSVNSIDLDALF